MNENNLRFVLLRQDDNGNKVEIATYASRADAEREKEVFERRGHKQLYWREALPASSGLDQAPRRIR